MPFGSCRTAATEPMVSVLVATAAGSCRVTIFDAPVDGDGVAVACACAPATPATEIVRASARNALLLIACIMVCLE